MNFYDNFLRLCNAAGKSPSRVLVEIGGTKSAVTRWKNGGMPTDATAKKIADYFDISVDQLLGAEPEQQKKPADQKANGLLSTNYALLTPENKGVIDALIEKLLKSQSGE